MKNLLFGCALLFATSGCVTVPFQEASLVPMDDAGPRDVVVRFQRELPERFHALNTVVFEVMGRKFSGIGYIDIDAPGRRFKVVCLNPMGVKLFELSGDGANVVTHYAIGPLAERPEVASAIGEDFRRMYFDMVPAPGARVWKRKYRINYYQPFEQGTLQYVFAGEDGNLIEKNYYEDGYIVWRARYYEYQHQDGHRFPRGILYQQFRSGYHLLVKTKEIAG